MRIVAPGYPPDTPLRTPENHPLIGMSRRTLTDKVTRLATSLDWEYYDTMDSRRSKRGFADLVLWKHRIVFVSIKSTSGTLRRDQDETLNKLASAKANVHLWRPVDWISGSIEHELRRR